jgi:hypothetical protein
MAFKSPQQLLVDLEEQVFQEYLKKAREIVNYDLGFLRFRGYPRTLVFRDVSQRAFAMVVAELEASGWQVLSTKSAELMHTLSYQPRK